ncbi:WD40 repeat domain-containing protein [Streptomyces sp. NPDC050418]|uniref:WD40 repeat domain-containing protein n=1 Tax=Streptomyces sp. NPDC050418 TaxID=3365612 RepID=UPI0037883B11
MDELVRSALQEIAEESRPPAGDLAGRVVTARRRRRTRMTVGAALATTAAVIASVIAVPALTGGSENDGPQLASQMQTDDVVAHPKQSPPRDLIAAGRMAMAGYFTQKPVPSDDKHAVNTRTWHLLDQKTGKYVETTKWSIIDVAPGMGTAAVLEQRLPTQRIGLLNLLTGEVERWIPVEKGVAGVEFSPDGSKLVATTYSENPDLWELSEYMEGDKNGGKKKKEYMPPFRDSARTGFYVLDVASGDGAWSAVEAPKDEMGSSNVNYREDFAFGDSGESVYSGLMSAPGKQYYDFSGKETDPPANEKHLQPYVEARLSPNGKLAAGDFLGKRWETSSAVNDPATGKLLHEIRGQQLLAWADDRRLIAWDIAAGDNEFHNGLVLVEIGKDKTVPLTGPRKGNDGAAGRWTPIFATR